MTDKIKYKNAFNCKKCPMKNDSDGCPLWWEIPWENTQTGEVKVQKGCILSQEIGLPIVQSIVRAAHISSEHASDVRNKFYQAGQVLTALLEEVKEKKALPNDESLNKLIE